MGYALIPSSLDLKLGKELNDALEDGCVRSEILTFKGLGERRLAGDPGVWRRYWRKL